VAELVRAGPSLAAYGVIRWRRKDLAEVIEHRFGAVCPERGVGAGLALPFANADAMTLHLAEIGRRTAPDAHSVVVLDGAGWHKLGGKLRVPDNTKA
jgi:hypothetical protein